MPLSPKRTEKAFVLSCNSRVGDPQPPGYSRQPLIQMQTGRIREPAGGNPQTSFSMMLFNGVSA